MKTITLGKIKLGEPDAHVMMRHAKTILRALFLLALVTTIGLFIYLRPAAYLAALPMPVLFLAYIAVCHLERQSRVTMLRSANQSTISQEEVAMNIRYASISTAMVLALFLALATFVMATTLVEEWSMVGITAAVLFLLSVLMLVPYFSLFVANSGDNERDKLARELETREKTEESNRDQPV